jgi:small subunit ribosomal protein S1
VRNYKKGQEVDAIVLAVDVERERISLGIKQLDTDPFTSFTTINDRGAVVNGKVKSVDPRGAEIQLNEDVTGYLRASEISRDRVEDARNVLKEGDEVSVMVINVDRKMRSIQLSIKAKDNADEQQAMQRLSQTNERENAGTTSLGALLRAKLDNRGEYAAAGWHCPVQRQPSVSEPPCSTGPRRPGRAGFFIQGGPRLAGPSSPAAAP